MNEWLAARNILAVRLDNIGDVIMLGPALRAVKETSPQARLTLLTSLAGSSAVPLLPWIDDVITWRPIWPDVDGRMPLDPARERELIDLLAHVGIDVEKPFVLLRPGASAQARRYPAERYGVLARLLVRRGWQVLVTGVEREMALIEEVIEHAPPARYLVGGTTLAEYAAL